MALNYKALITLAEFRANILDASSVAEDSSHDAAVEDVIENVTERIENYLRRRLIVRRHYEYYDYLYWRTDYSQSQASDTVYSAYLSQWPVVKVNDVNPAAVANPSIHQDTRRIHTTATNLGLGDNGIEQVDYFAGYRRADHTNLATLQADEGASDLADMDDTAFGLTLELPWDIRQVCTRLVLYEIAHTASGKVGIGPGIQEIATSTFTQGAVPVDFVEQELRRLDHHRSWV